MVPEAQYWFEQAKASGNHPFATYALGIIQITGKTEGILNPASEDKVHREKVCYAIAELISDQPENLYYIDLDNLQAFLGAAAQNPNTESSEEAPKKKFDFNKWLKKEQAAIKKAQKKRGTKLEVTN